ncbi:Putative AMP-dependent synthetase and ligase [Moritella viscosa]|uniref:AMP-binding protein n=1 Tax=Moritella viscosa TaxID=80854 RepID=UPI00091CD4C2|nr:AMP-binding protein [Moritella viscosa]SGY87963.1 Putative AMP-dependent synthetase and ligase [Moritella viscosa]
MTELSLRQRDICFHINKQAYSFEQFSADIHDTRQVVRQMDADSVLLFHQSSYQFSVGFFALALEGRHIVMPPNAQQQTLMHIAQQCQASLGDIKVDGLDAINAALIDTPLINTNSIAKHDVTAVQSQPLQDRAALFTPLDCQITFFTSGSTGQHKPIVKLFSQLNCEVDVLINTFTARLDASQLLLSTVSHQHIYGLLFKLLLPLKSGLAIVNDTFEYPEHISQLLVEELGKELSEELTNDGTRTALLISSPAHLKRLSLDNVLITNKAQLQGVFSSGGPLPFEIAKTLFKQLSQAPIEVFGSTETGGIAWRQCQELSPSAWRVFPDISYRVIPETAQLVLTSPYINDANYVTEDRVQRIDEQHFEMLGRADRTVKHEEKRINLDHMERCLQQHVLVNEVRVIVLDGVKKQVLAAVVELTAEGLAILTAQNKKSLNDSFKQHLLGEFERICLPKKWRYPAQMPFNTQGKLVIKELEKLFD